jgi:mannitol-1-phosphate/altronate dehydrogenase
MPARRSFVTLLVGIGMFLAVYLVDGWLVAVGLHAESTWVDNILLSVVAAAMAFLLQKHQQRELRRQQQSAAVIEQMNHHIRNALQVIVSRTSLDQRDTPELEQINQAVARIDWALRKILPQSSGDSLFVTPESENKPELTQR